MGGTAYLIVEKDLNGNAANLLIDAPACDPDILAFLETQGGVRQWVITHRGAIGEAKVLQQKLQCQGVVQEQEAYLLPDIPNVTPFQDRYSLGTHSEVFWTPGFSPGAACVYYQGHGGVLFTGRSLLPNRQGKVMPLRFSKTFHWPRQLRSVAGLKTRFSEATLSYICPGANTGFLREQPLVTDAYAQLQALDLEQLRHLPVGF